MMIDTSCQGEGVTFADGARNGGGPITGGGPADKAWLAAGEVTQARWSSGHGPYEFVVAIRATSLEQEVD